MSALIRYDAMCVAIAEAHAIDEVKEIHDQAAAIEAYAKQAKNTDAEQKACEIRLRAERRAGQLLAARMKAKGGQPKNPSQHASTSPAALANLGISHDQSARWQKLAAIPDLDFEATFATSDRKPSTASLIAAHKAKERAEAPVIEAEPEIPPRKPVDYRALWLWGRLLDFERDGLLALDPNDLVDTMLDHMRETTAELAPLVAAWLRRIST